MSVDNEGTSGGSGLGGGLPRGGGPGGGSGGSDAAAELRRLKELLRTGQITQEEFDTIQGKLFG